MCAECNTVCDCGCLIDCEECLTMVIDGDTGDVTYLCDCEGLDYCPCEVPEHGPARHHNYGIKI